MTASVPGSSAGIVHLALGILPVLAFLGTLVLLDSYKLVRPRTVAGLLLAGGFAAGVGLLINPLVAWSMGLSSTAMARYAAPLVEEVLKGLCVVFMIRSRRIGFLVDAAIAGFAVGAGFATVENVRYFVALNNASVLLWLIRGFGTAVMHGSVTAIMAIVSKRTADRRGSTSFDVFLPGLTLAVVLHSAFNHFFLAPNLMTVLLLTVIPSFFVLIFRYSESRTREWLGTGFDTDVELLRLITSGRVSDSRIGAYLESLKTHFDATTVVDMLCLLRLRLELSIKAKGMFLMSQAGFKVTPDPGTEERLAELEFLERNIGRTGLLALGPVLHMTDRDLWQYHMLSGGRRRPG